MKPDKYLTRFLQVLNVVQPDHPYDDDPYPVEPHEVDYSYCTSYWARCGPRASIMHTVAFSRNRKHIENMKPAAELGLYTHEITHVPYGSHTDDYNSKHSPRFWDEMAFHAQLVLDNWDTITTVFDESPDRELFREYIANDPNDAMVDQRIHSYEDVRERMDGFISDYSAGPSP